MYKFWTKGLSFLFSISFFLCSVWEAPDLLALCINIYYNNYNDYNDYNNYTFKYYFAQVSIVSMIINFGPVYVFLISG